MWWWMALAYGAACETIGQGDVMAVTPPAIVVLGDRHGVVPDSARATRIVRAFARRAPTTLALEAIPADRQPVLDRFAAGELYIDQMHEALDWERIGSWPFLPYGRLLEMTWEEQVPVVAAGLSLGLPPEEAEYPVPGGYMSVLRDALGEGEMPLSSQADFVRTLAWRDYSIAERAVSGWSGEGYLVILADRLHVEGGKGVPWQAGLLSRAPVHAFLLAWAHDPPCFPGDRVWAPGLSEKLAGAKKPPTE